MNDQPRSIIRKAPIGWYVHVETDWVRRGLKAHGSISPWWRATRRSAEAKGARERKAMA